MISRDGAPEDRQKETREKALRAVEEAFAKARAYRAAKANAKGGAFDTDLRWEGMQPLLEGKIPLFVEADEITQIQAEPLQLRIAGRAGTPFAITTFMRGIEASPFLRAVQLERTEQAPSEEDPDEIVYVFELLVTYEQPPIEELETVPLLVDEPLTAALPDSLRG